MHPDGLFSCVAGRRENIFIPLQSSAISIQNYIQQGKIKVIRFGQTVRIPESSLIPVDEVENASDVGDGQ